MNKRPSYLKQTDSLDKLASAINVDPNDIFEQPLPGVRPAQAAQNDYAKQNLPSPGSDALGREVKRHGPPADQPVYKSKFLQQYEQEHSQEDDYEPPPRQQTRVPARSNPPVQTKGYEYQSPVKAEEPDEPFMNSLRGSSGKKAPSKAAGPGWNDDTTSGGFAPAPVRKGVSVKGRAGGRVDYDQEEAPPARVPVGGRRAAPQPRAAAQDWNMDTEVSYAAPSALPPKVSPRLPTQQRRTDTDGAATQARPNLSLLKSKIRRSESGKNVLAMEASNSTSSGFGGQDYNNSTAEKVADIRNGGRRSAPNQRVADEKASAGRMSRTTQGQRYEEERDEEPAYVPSQATGRGRVAPVQSKPAQRPAFNAQYDEEDDPYGPDAYPPGGYPSTQKAKPAPVVQKKTTSDSRWDDDPYGPDAYPPGGYPSASASAAQQSKPKAAPVAQPRRAADSRFDADPDPYGPDAYPPGGYPPARSQPVAQAKAKAPPAAQARRAAPQPTYVPDDDPYGPDAYPPGGYPPPAAAAPTEYPEESGEMRECPHCGRKFNVTPYAKHIKICEKVFIKKRKVFDSTKMRIQGVDPELEKILAQAAKDAAKQAALEKRNAAKGGQNQAVPVNKKPQAAAASGGGGGDGGATGKWKDQSNAFREAMKAARQYSKAVAEGKPLPPPVASAPDASLILCPTCGRRFNQKAAERHIPQCKNIIAKPTMLKRGGGGGGGVNGTAAVQAGGLGSTKGKGRF